MNGYNNLARFAKNIQNKYHNQKMTVNGIKFDSKKEFSRFLELEMLEKSGNISELQRQVKFQVVPKQGKNNRARYYIADFVYKENGNMIIEDVKSPITRKDAVYSLKKAAVLAYFPEYEFREYL